MTEISRDLSSRHYLGIRGWQNVIGTVTCYGWDGPGFEHRWLQEILPSAHPSRTAPMSTPHSIECAPGLLYGQRQGRGVNHPSLPSPRLKKKKNYTSTPPLCLHGRLLGKLYPLPLHLLEGLMKTISVGTVSVPGGTRTWYLPNTYHLSHFARPSLLFLRLD